VQSHNEFKKGAKDLTKLETKKEHSRKLRQESDSSWSESRHEGEAFWSHVREKGLIEEQKSGQSREWLRVEGVRALRDLHLKKNPERGRGR